MKEITNFPKSAFIIGSEPVKFYRNDMPSLAALARSSPSATPAPAPKRSPSSAKSPSTSVEKSGSSKLTEAIADDEAQAFEMMAGAPSENLVRLAGGGGKYSGIAKAELKKRGAESGAMLALMADAPSDAVRRLASKPGSLGGVARVELAARAKTVPSPATSSPAPSAMDDEVALSEMLSTGPTEAIQRMAAAGGIHANEAAAELWKRAREHPGMNVLVPRGGLLRCRAENQDASATTFFGATK